MLVLLGAVLAGALIYILWRSFTRQTQRLPLPPYSSASMVENIKSTSIQKTLYQVERNVQFFKDIKTGSFGSSAVGATYQTRVPLLSPLIITSDYLLAKLFLNGDSKLGITDGEKPSILRSMNFLDRDVDSLLTHKTSNTDRERARKCIAQAFSTSNLTRTWPHIQAVLTKQFESLRGIAVRKEVIDVKSTIVLFFMRTLARGAFGVEFTDDGTESENNINGLEYLQAMDTAARESAREAINPFRKYMFWEEGLQRNAKAVKTLHRMAVKILRLHQERKSSMPETRPFTILDHIAHHSYGKDLAKLTDVTIFGFAGIDTTAYTFCFLLMELAKNPTCKAKLQQELASFMPARPYLTHNPSTTENDKELLSAIANCEYLSFCVKEILRLWPVVAGGSTRELLEDIEYNGMLLPKGSLVVAQYYSMFRERWIEEPVSFKPERWSESNPQLPQLKEMNIPFSIGRRSCIGQNMALFQLKIVAAHFLHYFDFELVGVPTFEYFVTMKPDDLKMRVIERM